MIIISLLLFYEKCLIASNWSLFIS